MAELKARTATVTRTTKETDITLTLNLDGTGKADIHTGVGFFDHMLTGFTRHGLFDLSVTCRGDLEVDCHHTVEDIGIVLGTAIKEAVGGKEGIRRFGDSTIPMDEALILCALDLSNRPYYSSDLHFVREKMGDMDTDMVKEFFYAVSYSAMMNLHFKEFSGENDHHVAECAFKAFGRALDAATQYDPRLGGAVLTTKGLL